MKVLSANGNILEVCHPSGGCYVCKSGFFGYYDKLSKRAFFDFTFLKEHQGPPGYAHGGYIALFLDEVMSFATYDYFPALLGKMEIYYKRSVPLENKVLFEAKLVKVERKKIIVEGSITYNGETLVKSSGIYVRI